jgi:hypothetical protein
LRTLYFDDRSSIIAAIGEIVPHKTRGNVPGRTADSAAGFCNHSHHGALRHGGVVAFDCERKRKKPMSKKMSKKLMAAVAAVALGSVLTTSGAMAQQDRQGGHARAQVNGGAHVNGGARQFTGAGHSAGTRAGGNFAAGQNTRGRMTRRMTGERSAGATRSVQGYARAAGERREGRAGERYAGRSFDRDRGRDHFARAELAGRGEYGRLGYDHRGWGGSRGYGYDEGLAAAGVGPAVDYGYPGYGYNVGYGAGWDYGYPGYAYGTGLYATAPGYEVGYNTPLYATAPGYEVGYSTPLYDQAPGYEVGYGGPLYDYAPGYAGVGYGRCTCGGW